MDPSPIQLRLLGTGTAFHTDGRGSPAVLVEGGGAPPFLVDAGPTVVAACARLGVDYAALERIFVTHLHGDHFAGWPFLRLNLAFEAGRTHPIDVHGPRGVRAACEGLEELCYGDLFSGESSPFDVRYHEHEVGEKRGLGDGALRYDLFPMDHHPSSAGYRFEVAGRSFGVTGDTRWCDNLERLATECELVVMECSTRRPGPHAHVSLDELREGIGRLGDCRIVLIHLTDAVACELAADPIPCVVAGYDGMTVSLQRS
jgi:ribonuclease BN (tRNA processing enzyme)